MHLLQRIKQDTTRRISLPVFLSLLLLVDFTGSTPVYAAEQAPDLTKPSVVVPEQIAGVRTLTAEQVIELMTQENPPLMIDARINRDREYGYIESSISLPDIETNCQTLKTVTPDKSRQLLFYCNGVQCGRSVVSIKVARSCGYHNLVWFRGGFAEWKEKGYQYIKQNH